MERIGDELSYLYEMNWALTRRFVAVMFGTQCWISRVTEIFGHSKTFQISYD